MRVRDLNLRTVYSRCSERAGSRARVFCSRARVPSGLRCSRTACGNERPMARALVGPHGALAWSRINVDVVEGQVGFAEPDVP